MLIEVNNKVKVIRPKGKTVFPYSNSLFIDDDVSLIIDAGSGGRSYKDIPINKVDILLITHFHFDHINGISFFENAEVMAGEEEAEVYSDYDVYLEHTGYHRWWKKIMVEDKTEEFGSDSIMPEDVPSNPGFQHIELDYIFKDGDVFDLGKSKVTAIHTPGHSYGHYAFYIEKDGILFSGDLDLAPWGPWYGGGYSNFDDLVKSVQKLIDIKPHVIATSHRKVFYDNVEQHLKDYINVALKKEDLIYDFLSVPRTFDEITSQRSLFTLNPKTQYVVFWNRMMILRHLERMELLGIIGKNEDGKYIRK
ncbi:hypothetical protein SYNTR_1153 [Candidatus Syntrophocurvum alkaliphilum]|uniref:Metallo-beta-lactamase domain-containing protein n=1 Tax=Candidatus Syntrophocurvum alkaliphilum TaxID=2293317 RepID=A0A6I6DEY0_9FIRM|nr:MBL fold metallo-hydrolase [Candidatus Syntrophocurvum alkaliphilum]QGT99746.1 hypothetical protein SYNTR_1153 [Candidatus Syntrophocurvum alkaliphilum]